MGAKGRQFVLKHHDYSVLAQKFLKEVLKENKTFSEEG